LNGTLIFAIGFICGSLSGVISICVLQINRMTGKEDQDE